MKFVVTGALGHIGSAWIRSAAFTFPGSTFVLIDNLSAQRYCSLFDLPEVAQYRFVESDILQSELDPLFEGADAVVHFAAITNAAESFGIKEEVERVNYQGTVRVAEACLRSDVPLFFPSTTSVYGTQESRVDEFCSITELKPQSPYAESKLRSEQTLQTMAASGLRCVIVRFGTIFGTSPGMRFHTAVNKFCWQAMLGLELTVWRTALDQKRPYLSVDDACRVLDWFVLHDRFDGNIYNAVSQNATVRNIVEAIEACGIQAKVQLVDTQIMNQLSYEVANTRLDAEAFEFRGRLPEGVAETLARLRQSGSAPPLREPLGIR